jgi:hypothetical protein
MARVEHGSPPVLSTEVNVDVTGPEKDTDPLRVPIVTGPHQLPRLVSHRTVIAPSLLPLTTTTAATTRGCAPTPDLREGHC